MSSKVEEIRDAIMAAFDATPDGEDASIPMALAAIEAMREPNDAMLMAGGEAILNTDEEWKSNACYRAMIDAALSEEGE